jgi:lipopolysaccharide transport protein LptA
LLDGNIVMTAVPSRRVTADRVELDQKSDSAVLTGRVEVVNGETVLTGRRLYVDRKNGRTSLTAPPMSGSGPGRITAHFVQKSTGAKKPESAPTPTAAGIAQFKTSPDAPLDIEADSLDVDDTARVAIFRGDVLTRQGEVTMRSAEIKGYYTGSARLADVGGGPAAEAAAPASELSRIDANGRVTVTTADGRKVTGDWAKYEAKANTITIGGEVELSQGTSVVRGKRLVIDMRTGKATIDTTSPKVVEKPADGWSTEAAGRSSGGRPSAIFFPDELRKAQGAAGKKKPTEAPPAPDASGWNSQTTPPAPSP